MGTVIVMCFILVIGSAILIIDSIENDTGQKLNFKDTLTYEYEGYKIVLQHPAIQVMIVVIIALIIVGIFQN